MDVVYIILSIMSTIVSFSISIIAIIISIQTQKQQVEAQRQQSQIDLYDKRSEIYILTGEVMGFICDFNVKVQQDGFTSNLQGAVNFIKTLNQMQSEDLLTDFKKYIEKSTSVLIKSYGLFPKEIKFLLTEILINFHSFALFIKYHLEIKDFSNFNKHFKWEEARNSCEYLMKNIDNTVDDNKANKLDDALFTFIDVSELGIKKIK